MSWLREPDAEPLPGYRLTKPLGAGGFGEVWECEAPGGILKGIKFVYGNLNSIDSGDVRAEQEWRAVQRIREVRHPFVLTIERIDVVDGELAIVMELADRSLHDVMEEARRGGLEGIPREPLLRYLHDAGEGLDYIIEKHNLQHLDVKPRNLFQIADRVKIADFGLVKHLERQSSSGFLGGMTPVYSAPETFTSKISRNTDQYSLGIVYCELLTGRFPFSGRNIRQLAIQHTSEAPNLSILPERDRPIVARALAKNPADRFPSCVSFIRALQAVSGPESQVLPLPTHRTEIDINPDLMQTRPGLPSFADERRSVTRNELGVLRPTLLVGMGSFGRKILREVRHRLTDRFGDLAQLPTFRCLYLDSDPDAGEKAASGTADSALTGDQFFPLRLQAASNYRRRAMEHLNDWLPQEKLVSIPRSLQLQGSRSLGRLAFSDNYLRLTVRLRRELLIASHPESLAQSIANTGLLMRSSSPTIIVVTSAGGGSSGALLDLGYCLRQVLAKARLSAATIQAYLHCGALDDPGTTKTELANIYATLTELNHFNDPSVGFSGQYSGPDGPALTGRGIPFSSVYLTQLESRSPGAMSESVVRVSSMLTQELTTPLGGELETHRRNTTTDDRTVFRSMGNWSVWFPRGLMLRSASRQMCRRLLEFWQEGGGPSNPAAVEAATREALAHGELESGTLDDQIARVALLPAPGFENIAARTGTSTGGTTPAPTLPADEAMTRLISAMTVEMNLAQSGGDGSAWATRAMDQIREWVGVRGGEEWMSSAKTSRLRKAFNESVRELADRWRRSLSREAFRQMDLPGRRIAAAEESLTRMVQWASGEAMLLGKPAYDQAMKAQQARADAQATLDTCVGGAGFRLFGSRSNRHLRQYLESLAQFAKHRLSEERLESRISFYRAVQTGLEEAQRDLAFCRQRLTHLERMLESPGHSSHHLAGVDPSVRTPWMSLGAGSTPVGEMAETGTMRVILPYGEDEIPLAAIRFLQTLRMEDWVKLEGVLQSLVLAPQGGLFSACQKTSDLLRQLALPMIDQTAAFLGDLLPITDVAEVELSIERPEQVQQTIRTAWKNAVPPVAGTHAKESAWLLVPDSPSGEILGRQAVLVEPTIRVISVPGHSTDWMLCREQHPLSYEDLEPLLASAKKAYTELNRTLLTSPHSRFDIAQWLPIE